MPDRDQVERVRLAERIELDAFADMYAVAPADAAPRARSFVLAPLELSGLLPRRPGCRPPAATIRRWRTCTAPAS